VEYKHTNYKLCIHIPLLPSSMLLLRLLLLLFADDACVGWSSESD